jgi:parallel beta-helix repeat protein
MLSALAAAFPLARAATATAAVVPVTTAAELQSAIGAAQPGDEIVLAAGDYALGNVTCGTQATGASPIVVRAETALGARIQFDGVEGFRVTGAHWHFEGLDIRGVCAVDDDCEHAFHVSGDADGFVMRACRVRDFNAQLKVNAAQVGGVWVTPDGGLIEGNELGDTRVRNTGNPTTKLNIDTGDDWIVRANYVHDFHKGGGNTISYGVFLKSGGARGLVERNLVICERDVAAVGPQIGLSFGGGGTAPEYCAPAFDAGVPCSVEHTDGTMRNNIVVNCSDVGVYLNRAANSSLLHNTLVATTGIDFRFSTTSGEARGNVLTSQIRDRDGATHVAADNLEDVSLATFQAMYLDPLAGDLRASGSLAALIGQAPAIAGVSDDYCARDRGGAPNDLGALEHVLGDCETTTPPWGGAGSGGTAGTGGASGAGGASGGAAGGAGAAASGGGGGAAGGSGAATGGSGGGSAATGGSGAVGGAGTAGSGAAAAGGTGGGASGASPGASPASGDESGCGCRVAAATPPGTSAALLLVVAAARRRRRARRAPFSCAQLSAIRGK